MINEYNLTRDKNIHLHDLSFNLNDSPKTIEATFNFIDNGQQTDYEEPPEYVKLQISKPLPLRKKGLCITGDDWETPILREHIDEDTGEKDYDLYFKHKCPHCPYLKECSQLLTTVTFN